MTWALELFDRFLGAVWVAVFAVIAAQLDPFATQYIGRSSAALAEAEAHLKDVRTGLRYQTMAEATRAELEAAASEAVAAATRAHDAVAGASALMRPLALVRKADAAVRAETWRGFAPAMPRSPAAIAHVIAAMIVGFAVHDVLRFLVVVLFQEPKRRRFKKRGALI